MSTQPAGAIAAAIVDFLRSHPPFDHVEDATLAALAAACRVAYFARGESIVSPASGVSAALYIVNKGRVLVEQSDENRGRGHAESRAGTRRMFSAQRADRPTRDDEHLSRCRRCLLLRGSRRAGA
jgi:CBS domain-containing protein